MVVYLNDKSILTCSEWKYTKMNQINWVIIFLGKNRSTHYTVLKVEAAENMILSNTVQILHMSVCYIKLYSSITVLTNNKSIERKIYLFLYRPSIAGNGSLWKQKSWLAVLACTDPLLHENPTQQATIFWEPSINIYARWPVNYYFILQKFYQSQATYCN